MARVREKELDTRDPLFDKIIADNAEQRGRQYTLRMRHEYNNKNILFKGTMASNANEFIRSRSQFSRNSSTHSNRSSNVGTRNNSITIIPPFNNSNVYSNTKSLLSLYNDKIVADTVVPHRHSRQITSRAGSRASSTHSLKKNYTFGAPSSAELCERQESIVDSVLPHEDPEFRLDVEVRRRFNKAASISGPAGLKREFKKSSLNRSFNASSNSSMYSGEDKQRDLGKEDEDDDELTGLELDQDISYELPTDNVHQKQNSLESASPKTMIIPPQIETETQNLHSHPMRTLQRQMNIRDQVLFIDKDENHTDELTQKWNSFVSLDDRRMFESITNDLRKLARYNQKPVLEALHRCGSNNYVEFKDVANSRGKVTGKFDLSAGRAEVRKFWNELKEEDQEVHKDDIENLSQGNNK